MSAIVIDQPAQWRPIESAPKDGSEVLLYRADGGVMLGRYVAPIDFCTDSELAKIDEDSAEKADWFCADFIAGGRLDGDLQPTHWQPLPEPPK